MCLTIITKDGANISDDITTYGNKKREELGHTRVINDNLYAPRIAGYNMLVWKILQHINADGGVSPYQQEQWYFGEEKNVQMEIDGFHVREIGPGLHAYISEVRAKRGCWVSRKVCPAVIPKGAEFYIGINGDIVANRMTVYAPNTKFPKINKADFSKHVDAY